MLLLFVGCAEEPTVVTETYPNGQKKEEGDILNDRREGIGRGGILQVRSVVKQSTIMERRMGPLPTGSKTGI